MVGNIDFLAGAVRISQHVASGTGNVLVDTACPHSDQRTTAHLHQRGAIKLLPVQKPHAVLRVQNFFGIIPLALILGDVTEDLALRSGEVIGGLVNATFGNVVELILSCVALTKKKQALNNVAGLSNLGSILSNLLLVLGAHLPIRSSYESSAPRLA